MLIRIKSPRAPYRRGGLKFLKAKVWQEIDVREIGKVQFAELLADPVLAIEGRTTEERGWEPAPLVARHLAREWLAAEGGRSAEARADDGEAFAAWAQLGPAEDEDTDTASQTSASAHATAEDGVGAALDGEAGREAGPSQDPAAPGRKAKPGK